MNTQNLKLDLRMIKSDPMLMMSMATPLFLLGLLAFLFPLIKDLVLSHFQYDIQQHYYQCVIFTLPLTPMLFGMVYGFILLDERDQGIITLISVTPYGKSGYLKTRLSIPSILSFITILALCLTLNINELVSISHIIIASLALSLNAPLVLMFLGAFASNKIEGIAISKAFGLILIAILIEFILPHPYNWLGAYSPLFWVAKSFFAESSISILFLCTGLFLHIAVLWLCWKYFNKKNT